VYEPITPIYLGALKEMIENDKDTNKGTTEVQDTVAAEEVLIAGNSSSVLNTIFNINPQLM
jgi:hypothetical protein